MELTMMCFLFLSEMTQESHQPGSLIALLFKPVCKRQPWSEIGGLIANGLQERMLFGRDFIALVWKEL